MGTSDKYGRATTRVQTELKRLKLTVSEEYQDHSSSTLMTWFVSWCVYLERKGGRLTVCCQTEDDDCKDGLDDANGQHPVEVVEAVSRHVVYSRWAVGIKYCSKKGPVQSLWSRKSQEKRKRRAGNIKQNEEKRAMMQCRAWLRLIKMKAIYLGS